MQVKKFEAKNMDEALKVIKKELGPEAIILSTKQNKKSFGLLNRPSVVVTAAISDHALLKKKLAESKMKDDLKEKVQTTSSKIQADTYDRFANKFIQNKNEKNQKQNYRNDSSLHSTRLSKRYIDVMDQDEDKELYGAKPKVKDTMASPPVTVKLPAKNTPQQRFQDSLNQGSQENYKYGEIGVLREHLIWVGVQPEIATQIVTVVHNDNETWKKIRNEDISTQIQNLIPTVLNYIRIGAPLTAPQNENKRVYAFLGSTGVGKTTTIAKIATRLKISTQKKLGFVTTDIFRMGGVDHLQSYADILGYPLIVADSPEKVPAAVGQLLSQCDLVLIDTPGCSEFNLDRLAFIKNSVDVLPQCNKFLVTPVNQPSSSKQLKVSPSRYGGIMFDGHIFTKIDETDVRGEIINRAYCSKRPVYYLTQGQKVPDDIQVATRERIGQAVFHQYSWE